MQRAYAQIIHDWGQFDPGGEPAGQSTARYGPPYDKPSHYLASYFAEVGFDEKQVRAELAFLALRRARGNLGLFGVAAVWHGVAAEAKRVCGRSLRKLKVSRE